jgi:RNA 2',3'-cyclic 3'-phosphodiesterase
LRLLEAYREPMAKERLKSPRARLFVALDLPEDVRAGLEAWQARELNDEALLPVDSQALHITLCFLNYHPERKIDQIAAVATGIEHRPVELRFEAEPKPLPKGRPRLFAIGADSEAAITLQQELSDALEARRFYEPEKREFWPHVTVARVRTERAKPKPRRWRGKGKPRPVTAPPGSLPSELLRPFAASRVALYRSYLRPTGAEYVRLAELNLASDER